MVIAGERVDEGRLWRALGNLEGGQKDIKKNLVAVAARIDRNETDIKDLQKPIPINTKPEIDINLSQGKLHVRNVRMKDIGRTLVWVFVLYLFLHRVGIIPDNLIEVIRGKAARVAEVESEAQRL